MERKIYVEVSPDGQELLVHIPIAATFERDGAEGLVRAASLTVRERMVVRGLMNGLTDKEIADELHLSIQSVKNLGTIVRLKLGVRSRHELRGRFNVKDVNRLVCT